MVRDTEIIAIFQSIHRVMKAEKVLKLAGADILLIPVPRQLSSDCGLAIRYSDRNRSDVEKLLRKEELLPVEIYRRNGKNYDPVEVS